VRSTIGSVADNILLPRVIHCATRSSGCIIGVVGKTLASVLTALLLARSPARSTWEWEVRACP
jgi:hypothetical protein